MDVFVEPHPYFITFNHWWPQQLTIIIFEKHNRYEHEKLTHLPLISYDDQEGDACAKAVQRNGNSTGNLSPRSTHRVHDILIIVGPFDIRTVAKNHNGCHNKNQEDLHKMKKKKKD